MRLARSARDYPLAVLPENGIAFSWSAVPLMHPTGEGGGVPVAAKVLVTSNLIRIQQLAPPQLWAPLPRNRWCADSSLEGPASGNVFDTSRTYDAPLGTGENEVIAGGVASPFIFSVAIS